MTGVIYDWSTTAGSNGTVEGINIAEGCPAGNVNNALRAIMAVAKNTLAGDISSTTVTTSGNVTAGGAVSPGNLANYSLSAPSGTPTITFDTGDVLNYDRSGNAYNFSIGGSVKAAISGSGLYLSAPLATTYGGTGGNYANLAALLTAMSGQTSLTLTSNASGVAVGIPIGGVTYYLQFMPVGALGGNGSTSVSYPVALSTAVYGAGCTKYVSGPINDGLNLYGSPGLSSLSVVNGGTSTSGGYAYVFGR